MDRDALVALCEKRFRDVSNAIVNESSGSSNVSWVDYLEHALSDVNGASPWWPWLENSSTDITIAAGVRLGALPSDTTIVNSVYNDTQDYPLRSFEGRAGMFQDLNDDTRGKPIYYRLIDTNIAVYPLPDESTTFKVEYSKFPSTLSSAGTEPPFPETFHRYLVEGALAYAYLDDGNEKWYSMHYSNFEKMIEKMKAALLAARTQEYPTIRDTWWDE